MEIPDLTLFFSYMIAANQDFNPTLFVYFFPNEKIHIIVWELIFKRCTLLPNELPLGTKEDNSGRISVKSKIGPYGPELIWHFGT